MRYSRKNKKLLARFKKRRNYTRTFRPLIWGGCGLRCLSRIMLPRRRLQWLKTWIKWHYKVHFRRYKYNKYRFIRKRTQKYYWMRLRHVMPVTRKASKARMGKGKGEIKGWFANLRAGFFIFEFNLVKYSIVRKLFSYLTKKFTGRVQGIFRQNQLTTPGIRTKWLNTAYYRNSALLTYQRVRTVKNKTFFIKYKRDVETLV